MASTSISSTTFLALIVTLLAVSSATPSPSPAPTAAYRNKLPRVIISNNSPLEAVVQCSDESVPLSNYGYLHLTTSQTYRFTAAHPRAFSSCQATWGEHYYTNWNAFDPKRHSHLKTLYWSIRKRGVYFSRDRLNWKIWALWYTE